MTDFPSFIIGTSSLAKSGADEIAPFFLPKYPNYVKMPKMRNIFDQYDQQENRLTHALICTLTNDKGLILPFLRWLKCKNIPPLKNIHIGQQQPPGQVRHRLPDWRQIVVS